MSTNGVLSLFKSTEAVAMVQRVCAVYLARQASLLEYASRNIGTMQQMRTDPGMVGRSLDEAGNLQQELRAGF